MKNDYDYIPNIQYLNWDSRTFNLKVGKLELPISLPLTAELLSVIKLEAIKEYYDVVYIMVLNDNDITFTDTNLLFVDKKIVYSKVLCNSSCPENSQITSFSSEEPTPELYSLAFISGGHSRFKIDFHFSPGIFETMYRLWIERSVKREIADEVLVYNTLGRLSGMITYKKNMDKVQIGLIAVSEKNQGSGIGSQLIKSLEYKMFKEDCKKIEVATQGDNIQACKFYERNNYVISSITNIYHLWI